MLRYIVSSYEAETKHMGMRCPFWDISILMMMMMMMIAVELSLITWVPPDPGVFVGLVLPIVLFIGAILSTIVARTPNTASSNQSSRRWTMLTLTSIAIVTVITCLLSSVG